VNLIELEEKIKNLINRNSVLLNKNDNLFLVIEGNENKKDKIYIKNLLLKNKFFFNKIYFIEKIPLTKTMKVLKIKLLDKILNERL